MTRISTEAFIADLSARPAPRPLRLGPVLAGFALMIGGVLALFWAVFGLRPDLAVVLARPLVLAKSLLPLGLCALALVPLWQSQRPEARLRLWPLALPVLAMLALLAWGAQAAQGPDLWAQVQGQTAAACFAAIFGLSLVPMALGLWLLKAGASTQPRRSGALLGLALSGAIAAGYALHCVEDSPLFYGVWYSLAVLATAGLGAGLGGRILRW